MNRFFSIFLFLTTFANATMTDLFTSLHRALDEFQEKTTHLMHQIHKQVDNQFDQAHEWIAGTSQLIVTQEKNHLIIKVTHIHLKNNPLCAHWSTQNSQSESTLMAEFDNGKLSIVLQPSGNVLLNLQSSSTTTEKQSTSKAQAHSSSHYSKQCVLSKPIDNNQEPHISYNQTNQELTITFAIQEKVEQKAKGKLLEIELTK